MNVEISFENLKSLCKYHGVFMLNEPKGYERNFCIKNKGFWNSCDEFNCPYCELKDEDDGK